jgi:putative transposase
MPKRCLATAGGVVFHVLNRGANKSRIFLDAADYAAFERTLVEALARHPVRLLAYCLMPNHWHLVLWPVGTELPRLMHWLCLTHSKRWRTRHETVGNGHVYQGRYRAIPVQSDHYFLTLLRYVEANPLRSGLVARAEDWRWSSLPSRSGATARVPLTASPLVLPTDWTARVNTAASNDEWNAVRQAVALNEPFGDPTWRASLGSDSGSRVAESSTRLPESDITNLHS